MADTWKNRSKDFFKLSIRYMTPQISRDMKRIFIYKSPWFQVLFEVKGYSTLKT